MSFNLENTVRPNIWKLKPYSCARDEFKGRPARVFLDANESPYNGPYNRYPDPLQEEVKARLAKVKSVPAENIFLGNGSDEAIDLVYRIFCNPQKDNVVAIEPTYGMYGVCADINDVEYRTVLLDDKYQVNADKVLAATDANTKVIWLCTPNNPTGNLLDRNEIEKILNNFGGIVVVDEAYSDFASERPFRLDIERWPNIIVLNTFSKAWGCASIRLGMAFASTEIIGLMNKVKYPYNINMLTQQKALEMLNELDRVNQWVASVRAERSKIANAFGELPICEKVYPTDANFFLARVKDANAIYNYLIDNGVVVRNRNRVTLCGNCLRITVGTPGENMELIAAMRRYK
ncbi:MAG: histidinol-phosphate transaminase [Bacteroidaceae bacterium]|nr:histidinol-phosphate transaminase [Bacteroidaceae bacterium]